MGHAPDGLTTDDRLGDNHLKWFARRLAIEVYDLNTEIRMAAQVKRLSDVVREAKDAVSGAVGRAEKLRASAENLASVFDQVDSMTKEIDAAAAELQAEVGGLSNGGPPLDDTPKPAPTVSSVGAPVASNGTVAKDVPAALSQVQQANA